MVRKSRKGVVGKALPTATARYEIGTGIDFKSRNLSDGDAISSAVSKEEKERGLK